MLEEIKTKVKEEYLNTNFAHHQWYWDYHIVPMKEIALELAKKYDIDPELIELIVYLHDIGRARGLDNHAKTGAEIVSEMLKDHADRDLIVECISKHGKPSEDDRIEVKLIASADAVAHFLSPFFEIYIWENPERDIKSICEGNLRIMDKDWNKILLPGAKEMCRKEYEALKRIHKL